MEKGENNGVMLAAIAEVWGFKLGYAELRQIGNVDEYRLNDGEAIILNERLANPELSLLRVQHWNRSGLLKTMFVHDGVTIHHLTQSAHVTYNPQRTTLCWELYQRGALVRGYDTLAEAMGVMGASSWWN